MAEQTPASPSPPRAAALAQLNAFVAGLAALQMRPEGAASFAHHWRNAMPDAVAALPSRYEEVLMGLLDRLESSALFVEESCSFSHRDLLASLHMWADKAQGQLS